MALARCLKLLEQCIELLPADVPAYLEAEQVLTSYRQGLNSKLSKTFQLLFLHAKTFFPFF